MLAYNASPKCNSSADASGRIRTAIGEMPPAPFSELAAAGAGEYPEALDVDGGVDEDGLTNWPNVAGKLLMCLRGSVVSRDGMRVTPRAFRSIELSGKPKNW